jgi:hypothetical protein
MTAFDEIAAPGYLGDLTARPLEQIRAMRASCQRLEDDVSSRRRLLQGRLDIVHAERRRRAQGRDGGLAGLLEELPATLGSHLAAEERHGTHAELGGGEDARVAEAFEGLVDGGRSLVEVPELSDAELAAMEARLEGLERDVSAQRRVVFERLDALTAELTRRYRSGEATIEPPPA